MMKKLRLLYFFIAALLLVGCESEIEKEYLSEALQGKITFTTPDDPGIETRAASAYAYMAPRIEPGDRIGSLVSYDGVIAGPDAYTVTTVNGVSYGVAELPQFRNQTSMHTFYFYMPYEYSTSKDPKKVTVRPLPSIQTQVGATTTHMEKQEYYVGEPVTVAPGSGFTISLFTIYSSLEFRINTNMNDLKVNQIKVTAPTGKIMAYNSGTVDITRNLNNSDFGDVSNYGGASNNITLNVAGGLSVPNSTTSYSSAHMTINPFNAVGQKLKIEVYTNNRTEPYVFEEDADWYMAKVRYSIDLRIEDEEEPEPELKDIYVLSICDIGFLGTGNNEDVSAPNYGVNCYTNYSKAIRKVLKEHFGPDKTVKTGKIYFDEAGHCGGKLCCKTSCCCVKKNLDYNNMTEAQLDKYNIIFLNRDTRPNEAFAAKIMKWLNKSDDRVLMLSYDWKDSCVKPGSSTSSILSKCYKSTNYILLRDYFSADIKPHWYNCCIKNVAIGNWGDYRSGILAPFELNERTSYFWKNGPFKTNLNTASDQRYWVRGKYWGSAQVLSPNIIPLVTYRDARYTTSSCCYSKDKGDGGMILGVDPVKRVVYIGDSELFSVDGIKTTEQQNAKMSFGSEMNNYAKIMGNVWAWMIDEVIQKKK